MASAIVMLCVLDGVAAFKLVVLCFLYSDEVTHDKLVVLRST
jgi:hypothetical protein